MNRRLRLRFLGGVLVSALVIAGLIAAARAAEPNVVTMKDFDFAPMMLTVTAGATVTWKNLDGEPHTVVSEDGLFRSQALDQDESFAFKFDRPGSYKFLCSIHPKMHGVIVVK